MRPLVMLVLLGALPVLADGEPGAQLCSFTGRVVGKTEADTVVGLEPVKGSPPLPPAQPTRHVMHQRSKTFLPKVLMVRSGDWVEFENDDADWHSVFSASRVATFNFPESTKGTSGKWHFMHPGLARIQCNIHSNMRADVFVFGSPYWAKVDADGTWRIDAPEGAWRVVVNDVNGSRVDQHVSGCVTGLELQLVQRYPVRPRTKNGDVPPIYEPSN